MAKSIDPGAPKVGFWSKNLYFWAPFWHRFFDFFRKRRKCVISEEYNAKRGSEPSKTSDFRIVFSLIFHVFSEPPLREHFCCVRVPTCAQKRDFDRILRTKRSQNRSPGHRFRPPWRQKWYPGSLRKPSASRLGRDLAPKTLQKRILIDLGSISDRFWKDSV